MIRISHCWMQQGEQHGVGRACAYHDSALHGRIGMVLAAGQFVGAHFQSNAHHAGRVVRKHVVRRPSLRLNHGLDLPPPRALFVPIRLQHEMDQPLLEVLRKHHGYLFEGVLRVRSLAVAQERRSF